MWTSCRFSLSDTLSPKKSEVTQKRRAFVHIAVRVCCLSAYLSPFYMLKSSFSYRYTKVEVVKFIKFITLAIYRVRNTFNKFWHLLLGIYMKIKNFAYKRTIGKWIDNNHKLSLVFVTLFFRSYFFNICRLYKPRYPPLDLGRGHYYLNYYCN